MASHARCTASSQARTRLAKDERCIGTALPGCPGVLHPWGRQLQYHPHIHAIVPGGGRSKDRDAWRPSRAPFFGPGKALAPLSRAIWKEEITQAGRLESIDPQVWTIPWHVHSQAPPHGPSALTALAPYVFKVAISHRRLVSLTDRTGPCPYRKPGSARLRPTPLDARECIRRCLHHILPDGCMKVRHFGFLQARCALPPDPLRLMSWKAQRVDVQPTRSEPPAPFVAFCPTCGGPLQVVMRLWTAHSAFVDTG